MQFSQYSKNKLMWTLARWDVPRDFADPIYNYLVHGFNPGSCFTSILANDFMSAIQSSHPSNTVNAFKSLAGWICECCPKSAWGSYEQVQTWSELTEQQRRSELEYSGLIYSEKEEVVMILGEEQTTEPQLY